MKQCSSASERQLTEFFSFPQIPPSASLSGLAARTPLFFHFRFRGNHGTCHPQRSCSCILSDTVQWVWAGKETFPKRVSAILWLGQPFPLQEPAPHPFSFSNKTEYFASTGIDTASKANVLEAAAHSTCPLFSWTALSCSGLYSGLRTSRPCAVFPATSHRLL